MYSERTGKSTVKMEEKIETIHSKNKQKHFIKFDLNFTDKYGAISSKNKSVIKKILLQLTPNPNAQQKVPFSFTL